MNPFTRQSVVRDGFSRGISRVRALDNREGKEHKIYITRDTHACAKSVKTVRKNRRLKSRNTARGPLYSHYILLRAALSLPRKDIGIPVALSTLSNFCPFFQPFSRVQESRAIGRSQRDEISKFILRCCLADEITSTASQDQQLKAVLNISISVLVSNRAKWSTWNKANTYMYHRVYNLVATSRISRHPWPRGTLCNAV